MAGTGAWLTSLVWISSSLPGRVGLLGGGYEIRLLLSPPNGVGMGPLCPSPQGLPLGRFREENGIFQAVWAFRDLLVQPPSWMDGKTEVQRREEGAAQSHTESLPGLALTQVF